MQDTIKKGRPLKHISDFIVCSMCHNKKTEAFYEMKSDGITRYKSCATCRGRRIKNSFEVKKIKDIIYVYIDKEKYIALTEEGVIHECKGCTASFVTESLPSE